MTYKQTDNGNYTKVFDSSNYGGNLPETVDWRTSNAVTDIKNQVKYIHTISIHSYVEK